MTSLGRNPKIVGLAKELGLSARGDCLTRIKTYAIDQFSKLVDEHPVSSIKSLFQLGSSALSTKVEFIRTDADIERLAAEYSVFSPTLKEQLTEEFLRGSTDGYLLRHPHPLPGDRRFVAFIDARTTKERRAYFTGWHELVHLLVYPPQLAFPGFRRTVLEQIEKDPIESLVDMVAGELAFYKPLFQPVLQRAVSAAGRLSFHAIEQARAAATPEASFYATAIACVRITSDPVCLLCVDHDWKESEKRGLASPQLDLRGLTPANPQAQLRAVRVIPNDAAKNRPLRIFRNMRVPATSVLHEAYQSSDDTMIRGSEDQADWETTEQGHLPQLPIEIEAVRRGRYVYGLISLSAS